MEPPRHNIKNDRIKREYLVYLKDARQRSAATVDQTRHAIDRLESYTVYKDFGTFNKEQALGFKKALLALKAKRSGKSISTATAHHTLRSLKEFLAWLHAQPGYKRRIKVTDIAYLNLTTKEEREAHVSRPKSYASVDQYRAALFAMPSQTELHRRDQALVAFLLLTGMRDAAVVTLKLKHVSLERRFVFQDPREVKTKFSKPIETFFFPVGDDVSQLFEHWVTYLTRVKLFGLKDPVFPKSELKVGPDGLFETKSLGRTHWANATPVRRIFKEAFARIGQPPFKPHSVRDTLTHLAYKLRLDPEQIKAWSQNLGHESVLTTLGSYGHISTDRQAEIIASLPRDGHPKQQIDIATRIAEKVAEIIGR